MSNGDPVDAPMADATQEVAVDSGDVVRLIIQFLKENNLNRSMQTLQEESQIYLNAVESVDGFCDDIDHGRWDKVIQTLATVQLPKDLLQDIYEQAFLECLGAGEKQLCALLLKHSAPMQSMKGDSQKNLTYRKLDSLLNKPYIPVESELYQGEEKPEIRRKKLSSLDNTCRLHGMHSGRTLKEFRGHTSYVNCVGFADGPGHQRLVVSGCADGFVRVFDLRSSEILHKFAPPPPAYQNENITLDVSSSEDTLLICQQSSTVHQMTVAGQLLKSYESGKRDGKGDFLALCTSHAGRWIYAAAEDRTIYCFDTATGELENVVAYAQTGEVTAVTHHPNRNILAVATSREVNKLISPAERGEYILQHWTENVPRPRADNSVIKVMKQ
ncbi:wd-repeat protein, putative [Perkinsus marinus ATCC 50983]|uniref:Wd-repeat protein, putative n=1 Tax=Perkinsus marinus (strain ATCC 50983 / TXsc) TaxID=423536 RepID=C5KP49_PERM5|nr:wd-repeat protein, putative [Perkinsus marinus ATCC 50983]EER13724.1 wd-repeat protein, putative [Perkinsus marinus ATCC 50983]|eukprot:XP_002781929.1 wd-repeat protein, putative [Perkinsus marinus ATCC 50983]